MSQSIEQILIYEKLKQCEIKKEHQDKTIEQQFCGIDEKINKCKESADFEYYFPIASQKKISGRLVLAYKRFVRKSVAFIFASILKQQTEENNNFAQVLGEVSALAKDIQKQNAIKQEFLENKINLLQTQLEQEQQARKELEIKLERK